MNRKWTEALEALAAKTGLQVEEQTHHVFGDYKGYTVCVALAGQNNMTTMMFSVSQNGDMPSAAAVRQFAKQCKSVSAGSVQRRKVSYTLRGGMTVAGSVENIQQALDEVTAFFQDNGFVNCCEHCGQSEKTDACLVGGNAAVLCENCFADISSEEDVKAQAENRKRENPAGGLVGALLGSLAGMLAIVLIGQLGYISVWAGVITGVCTIKGYEWLGRRLSAKGVLMSVLVIVGMVYAAHRIDWTISVYRQIAPGADVFTVFKAIPEWLRDGSLDAGSYFTSLGLLYLFSLLGAIPTIGNVMRNRERQHITARMSGKKDDAFGR